MGILNGDKSNKLTAKGNVALGMNKFDLIFFIL